MTIAKEMNYTAYRLVAFVIMALTAGNLLGQPRGLWQAKVLASECLNRQDIAAQSELNCINEIFPTCDSVEEGKSPFYFFTDSATATFIIVSGDKRMKDVLGLGCYDVSNNAKTLPCGLEWLLDNYAQQYCQLSQQDAIMEQSKKRQIALPDVEPILTTTWNQDYPFNLRCPMKCPSGCVAMAMAQVMKHNNYPVSGKGNFDYVSSSNRYHVSFDYESSTFEWAKLKDNYPVGMTLTDSEEDAIAEICLACGVAVGMDYDSSGSGAYMSDVPYALIHFFGYGDNASYCDRTCFTDTEWYQMLCSELSEGRPVIYGGVDRKNGGHAFVVDGCRSRDGKFHVNWGWGGAYDGYFELDALDPGSYRFSSYQDMVINVSPEIVGTHRDVFCADKFTADGTIKLGVNVTYTLTDVYCTASQASYVVPNAKFYGNIGIGLFDADFNFVAAIATDTIDGMNNFDGYDRTTFSGRISKNMLAGEGSYRIAPFVKASAAPFPTRIRTSGGTTDYIEITFTGDDISEEAEEVPVEGLLAWAEDFEEGTLPTRWTQDTEMGNGVWRVQDVLLPSAETPRAANGNAYLSLEYASDMHDLYNTRAVTTLKTNFISLAPDQTYELSLQCRKYAQFPDARDILSVYYAQGDQWVLLTEIPVANQGDWNKTTVSLPVSGYVRLAFEGSVAMGSSLFLDNLSITEKKSEQSGMKYTLCMPFGANRREIYTLQGIRITEGKELQPGTYIIKQELRTRIIHIK